jgi:hypothetical protein
MKKIMLSYNKMLNDKQRIIMAAILNALVVCAAIYASTMVDHKHKMALQLLAAAFAIWCVENLIQYKHLNEAMSENMQSMLLAGDVLAYLLILYGVYICAGGRASLSF